MTITQRWWSVGAIAACGCGALAARPALIALTAHRALAFAMLFVGLAVAGIALPVGSHPVTASPATKTAIALAGIAAFAIGRVLGGGVAPARATVAVVAANTLAAIAEEAWFRRVCFGLCEPAGTAFAIGVTSLLFAAVHVTLYGFAVLPLDLAAGLVLGWQRAASGSWRVPALTHALANVLVLL